MLLWTFVELTEILCLMFDARNGTLLLSLSLDKRWHHHICFLGGAEDRIVLGGHDGRRSARGYLDVRSIEHGGKVVLRPMKPANGHGGVADQATCEANVFASAHKLGAVCMWDTVTGKLLRKLDYAEDHISLSRDGSTMLMSCPGGFGGPTKVWRGDTEGRGKETIQTIDHGWGPRFLANDGLIFTRNGYEKEESYLCDTAAGGCLQTFRSSRVETRNLYEIKDGDDIEFVTLDVRTVQVYKLIDAANVRTRLMVTICPPPARGKALDLHSCSLSLDNTFIIVSSSAGDR